jgi:uncharacterized damage-inducible protein DinB
VRANTIQIAQEIDEKEYGFQPAPGSRTVRQLLTHIATGYRFNHQVQGIEKRTSLEGFDFMSFMGPIQAEEQKDRSKAELLELLKDEGEKCAKWLEGLSDAFLAESMTMPPGQDPAAKTRFEMILGIKEHEMHHRGQLMLIQRLLGQTPHLTRHMQERMAAMREAAKARA